MVDRYSGEDRAWSDTVKILLGVVLGIALVGGLGIAVYVLVAGWLVMK